MFTITLCALKDIPLILDWCDFKRAKVLHLSVAFMGRSLPLYQRAIPLNILYRQDNILKCNLAIAHKPNGNWGGITDQILRFKSLDRMDRFLLCITVATFCLSLIGLHVQRNPRWAEQIATKNTQTHIGTFTFCGYKSGNYTGREAARANTLLAPEEINAWAQELIVEPVVTRSSTKINILSLITPSLTTLKAPLTFSTLSSALNSVWDLVYLILF